MMDLLELVNRVLWNNAVLLILLFTGLLFTVWSRFSQYKALTHGVALIRGKYDHAGDPGAITHFQALSAALSATVGLGNIAGVAIAVSIGGPGAVFWMWVVGFIGMALKTTEVIQSMLYRNISNPQNPHGGPMWVALRGFKEKSPRLVSLGKGVGVLFCITLLISTFTGGNMFQAWNVADITFSYFSIPKWVTGVVLTVLVGMVIIGGIKRIGTVAGMLVPFMCIFYMLGGLAVLIFHLNEIPDLLVLIVRSGLPEFLGGEAYKSSGAFIGGAIGLSFTKGMQRALFSNEAGQGSAPIAHSAAKTREPVSEGIVAGLEPFIDTLCVCTITALVILVSGAWNRPSDLKWETPPALIQTGAVTPVQNSAGEKFTKGQSVFTLVRENNGERPLKWMGELTKGGEGGWNIRWKEPPKTKTLSPLTLHSPGAFMEYKGATLTAKAFDHVFSGLGLWIVPLTVWLFAISTMISWNYYGEQGTIFIFGDGKPVAIYRWIYCLSILAATSPLIATEQELDILSSLGTGVMLWVNIPLMLFFGKKAMAAYFDYVKRIPKFKITKCVEETMSPELSG